MFKAIVIGLVLVCAQVASAGALQGKEIINTGAFPCNQPLIFRDWFNTTEVPIRVKKVHIWAGMSFNGKADYDGTLTRISDGAVVVSYAWDHYGNPNGPHIVSQDFTPDWIELAPGDGLRLRSFCVKVGGDGTPKGHHKVWAWWE